MLPKKETLTIEFKSDVKKLSDADIFDVVVAFSNTEGGDLYLGIEDSGEITGAHEKHRNPTTVSAFIANHTIPPVAVRAEIIEDIAPVMRISVPKSYAGIVATVSGKVLRRRIKADGTPENVPMYPSEFATRLSDLRLLDYSAMPLFEADLSDFEPAEINRLRQLISGYSGDKALVELSDEELFKALGFVREQNGHLYPTVTGLLMVGRRESLRRYIPTAEAVFQVLEGTEVKKNDDLTMPLLATIEKLNEYLEAWNPEQEIEWGLFRMSVPDFNKRAIREAIVNAFSHRDYTKMGRVRVTISDDGLTIANPGGFIEGVSIDNLLTAEPHGRNPQLADALKRIGLAERTGRGIDRIYEGSLLYGRALPDYSQSTNITVSLSIQRSKVDAQLAELISNEQNRLGRSLTIQTLLVLNALKDAPKSTVQMIAANVNLSENMVSGILSQSVETGLVDAFGTARNRSYMLSSKVYKTKEQKRGYVLQADIDESRYLELVLTMAQKSKYISKADVVALLHVDGNKAYQILRKLVSSGDLQLIQSGKYAKYRMIEKCFNSYLSRLAFFNA